MQATHMRELFSEDPERFQSFTLKFEDILVDYSKNLIIEETLKSLIELAHEVELKDAIDAMFNGMRINQTENRSVLHVALRNRSNTPVMVDGEDVMPEVNRVLEQMKNFSARLLSGEWKGYLASQSQILSILASADPIWSYMVTEALRPYWKTYQTTFCFQRRWNAHS